MDSSRIKRLDTDVFSDNNQPFAAYYEPEGFSAFPSFRKNLPIEDKFKIFKEFMPNTVEFAVDLWDLVSNKARFGIEQGQLSKVNWVTVRNTSAKTIKKGISISRGRGLRPLDVMNSLTGRTYALGTTDIFHVVKFYDEYEERLNHNYFPVHYLRIDVDMDRVWGSKDCSGLKTEVSIERELAEEFGFGYHVFATGRRGHQMVLSLPCKVAHPVASFLMTAYKKTLDQRINSKLAKVDCDSLRQNMRMPLGQHSKTGRLGLFIDTEKMEFYPISEQVEICIEAFSINKSVNSAFRTSLAELSEYYASMHTPCLHKYDLLNTKQFDQTLDDLKDNLLVQKFFCIRKQKNKNSIMTGSCVNDDVAEIEQSEEAEQNTVVETGKDNKSIMTGSYSVNANTREKIAELLKTLIPLGSSNDYWWKYGIPAYFLYGEDALISWFGMTSNEISSVKADERISKAKREIEHLKKKIAAGAIRPPKQSYQPNALVASNELTEELRRLVSKSRADKDRLVAIASYMVRCARLSYTGEFFRSYEAILQDNYDVFSSRRSERDKVKAVSMVLGIFVDGLLDDKNTGTSKKNFGIFRVVQRGIVGRRGMATSYRINDEFRYLLELVGEPKAQDEYDADGLLPPID